MKDNKKMTDRLSSPIAQRFADQYFEQRMGNDKRRQMQFSIDSKLIRKYKQEGKLCDVGCSTGEFIKALGWKRDDCYGIEVNESAKEIAKEYMSFNKDIHNSISFFDIVIMRGTLQHLNTPFYDLQKAYRALKPGGYLYILCTPNTESIVYRLKKRLPALVAEQNFWLPGLEETCNALRNMGYIIAEKRCLYLNSPYSCVAKDHLKFIANMVTNTYRPHAFWGNMFDIVAKKEDI